MYLFMHMYKMNTGMFFSALFTDDYVSVDSLRSDFQIVFGWFFFLLFFGWQRSLLLLEACSWDVELFPCLL